MNEVQRAKKVLKILNKIYPKTPIPLKHKNSFTFLISVLLSAQTTDLNVNNVTKNIYPKYNKPEHFVKLGRKKIERMIKSIGIFRNKAKSVFNLSKSPLTISLFSKDDCPCKKIYGFSSPGDISAIPFLTRFCDIESNSLLCVLISLIISSLTFSIVLPLSFSLR